MAVLTLAKIIEMKEQLRKISLKPYKGYFGLGPNGLFEIKNDEEFERLKKNDFFDVKNGTLTHPFLGAK